MWSSRMMVIFRLSCSQITFYCWFLISALKPRYVLSCTVYHCVSSAKHVECMQFSSASMLCGGPFIFPQHKSCLNAHLTRLLHILIMWFHSTDIHKEKDSIPLSWFIYCLLIFIPFQSFNYRHFDSIYWHFINKYFLLVLTKQIRLPTTKRYQINCMVAINT